MPNNETSWTTVSGKAKTKAAPSSTKSSAAPVIPKAEVKTIKLSDSAFSSMKDRVPDENDENETVTNKAPKPIPTTEKNTSVKATKPNKPTSNALTLKQTLQNINVDKLKQLYKSSKDNSSIWVEKICYGFIEHFKETTSGLNDPTFAKESSQEYPLNALSTSVRDYLKEIFDTQSKLKAITLCRNGILNPNADINGIVGYQTLLQYFLRNLDELPNESFLNDVDELSTSLKRYQSDKVLRLLWAYSQIQYEHPGLALDIWFRLMFPLIENRTYNQFVVENLSKITTRDTKTKKFLRTNEIFPTESYVKLLDFVDRPNPALTKEMRTSLAKSANNLSELFVNNTKNLSQHSNDYFKVLFPALYNDKQRQSKTQANIDRMIVACFTDKAIIKTWLSLHKKYPLNSLHLLSLLHTNEISTPGLSSSKEFRTIVQQLRTISNEEDDKTDHKEFLRVYSKNDTVVVNKHQTRSKSRIGSLIKLLIVFSIAYTIYSNWLWLTVAADYLLEDYLKHPTAIIIKEQLSNACAETKKFTLSSVKHGEEFIRSTMINMEPYVIKFGQYLQKQWNLLLTYIEGPIYDKTVEIAEQIQRLSMVIFTESVHYLNILFDWASYYTANFASLTEIYLKQIYAILYDKWTHFDGTQLREKFDQIRMRIIKSV
ncbi:unnamed protein product [Adineta steineri]|uniref:Uncharacterized protein n=1 Tax=Adineta steineri TaxID=433720 RepID=A0A815DEK1_9BILA|nr:unnamed protein product [Adineta steineri]CAF3518058.1 unnamed protein product [Adineta steineri]